VKPARSRPACLLALASLTSVMAGCSDRFEPPLFNYLACRQSMTLKLEQQGAEPVAANLQAMAYCRQQQALADARK